MGHLMLNGKGRNRKKHHKKSSENKLFHGPNVAREPRFRKRDGHIAIEKSNVGEPNLGEPSLTTERAHFSLGAGRNRTDEPFFQPARVLLLTRRDDGGDGGGAGVRTRGSQTLTAIGTQQ